MYNRLVSGMSRRWAVVCLLLSCAGCETSAAHVPQQNPIPHELAQVSLPPYLIEPPDVLVIDAIRLVPRPPFRVGPLDVLGIQVTNTLPNAPIAGLYSVETDGTVNLGFNYGSVRVDGLTLDEAMTEIKRHLLTKPAPGTLKEPITVTVALAETRAQQQIRGPHLVQPDGFVTLGVYGRVYVDRMSIPEAKAAIENHLSLYLVKPEVSLDVAGFNSKVFYVITDGAGSGAQAARFPMTGKLTVLDALCQVNGLSPTSSKCIYLVRPAPSGSGEELVCQVRWQDVARRGETATNYQVFPNDRIYIVGDPLVTADTFLARLISPAERLFGVSLLGETTVNTFRTPILRTTTITTTP
jgi:polysaccharide export outer membrane protein